MGSFRRQLIIVLLTASPAMADVCTSLRPGWVPADGPATALTELVQFLIWGGGGIALLGLVLGLYLRRAIILNAVLLISLVLAVPYIWPLDPTNRAFAMAEGCVGPPTLVLGLLAVIWLGSLAGTLLKRKAI